MLEIFTHNLGIQEEKVPGKRWKGGTKLHYYIIRYLAARLKGPRISNLLSLKVNFCPGPNGRIIKPGYKVSPPPTSIFLGLNVDLTSGLHCNRSQLTILRVAKIRTVHKKV